MTSLRQEATVIERLRIIEVAERESVTEAARRFECSRTTVYGLLARYQRGGLLALANQPRGSHAAIPEEVVELVVELKASAPHRASTKIQQLLRERYEIELSRQSIWRILSARGLARVTDPEPIVRFERPQPNQLWQMDLKEDVSFPFGRAHLLTLLDDASRYCLGGIWIRDKREYTVLGAVATLLERVGLPEAILTDRASVFYGPPSRQRGLTTYQQALAALGVQATFARAYKPRTKGKVEKFIQFLERDFIWEHQQHLAGFSPLQRAWEEWSDWYNQRRPHASLGDRPPATCYTQSHRAAPAELRKLLAVETVRSVRRDATISLEGRPYAVPPEFMGKHVWVGRLGDDITIEHAGRVVARYAR